MFTSSAIAQHLLNHRNFYCYIYAHRVLFMHIPPGSSEPGCEAAKAASAFS